MSSSGTEVFLLVIQNVLSCLEQLLCSKMSNMRSDSCGMVFFQIKISEDLDLPLGSQCRRDGVLLSLLLVVSLSISSRFVNVRVLSVEQTR